MIILLTDFGQSEYVGVMNGVIYSINYDAKIVDLCHDISAQNITEASWILKNNYEYFPRGSTFCCVVDPGVGSERKALAIKTDDYYFVGPDNGLFWESTKKQKVLTIRQINIPADASSTFHGRDVFAKAAASIDLGNFDSIGTKIEQIQKLEFYQNGNEGMIVRIDRFGNIITNLPGQNKKAYSVEIADSKHKLNYYPIYSAAKDDELFLILGSCNTLEISLKNGNANERLNLKTGQKIKIC